ncbi:paramyosin-like [Physella acuta]|uniref:paramyosin-like n=1 Tax=Physella acuta TaxID=109671 RepID=UPI0027DD4EAC|nr:paramyosin-like [Physella acuta]XP_059148330.1 paramyosin-like [Physella acuta]
MATTTHKNTFEFRMSKKVAELAQVVHLLFTRNHEKEIEMEALKQSYEYEIEFVIQDAKNRINKLETSIAELNKRTSEDIENLRKEHEQQLASKENDWRQRMSVAEKSLEEEKRECQKLSDMLLNAQRDIETLRQRLEEQLGANRDKNGKRDKEVDALRLRVLTVERNLLDAQNESQSCIGELTKKKEKLEKELQQMQVALDGSNKSRDQHQSRCKQLENEIKTMKIQFNKKLTEMANNGHHRSVKTREDDESSDEVERLRRELQKYRLELTNRDFNFNRMFTDKQPVLLDQRAGQPRKKSSALNLSNGSGFIPHLISPQGALQSNFLPQTFHKDRQVVKSNVFDSADPENQPDFRTLNISNDEVILDNSQEHANSGTYGQPFTLEQILPNEKGRSLKDTKTLSNVHDKTIEKEERPNSLPSISSSTAPRRLSVQLTKPKPLERSFLSGK